MTKKQKKRLFELCKNGYTDSDIEDFCDETDVSRKEAFHQISEWCAPECCQKCKHIDMFPSMPPCPSCSRGKSDLYEKE